MKTTKFFTLICAIILASTLLFSACGKPEVEGPTENNNSSQNNESVTDSESDSKTLSATQWKSVFDLTRYNSLSLTLKSVENTTSTVSTFKYKNGSMYVKHVITENGATEEDEFVDSAEAIDLKALNPYTEELIYELETLEDFGFSLFSYSEQTKSYNAKINLQVPEVDVAVFLSGNNLSKITLKGKGKINAEATAETSIDITLELSNYNSTDLPETDKPSQNTESNTESNTEKPATDEEKYNEALTLISNNNYAEAMDLLSSLKSYAPAQEKLKNFFYAPRTASLRWKDADNIQSSGSTITYTYDSMGNVLNVLNGDETVEYTYDAKGNRLTEKNSTEELAYTYANGKLTKITGTISTTTYEYNEKGQITKITVETDDGTDKRTLETTYEYTYYANGTVSSILKNNYFEYRYSEDGVLEDVIGYSDYSTKTAEFSLTPTFKNGKIAAIEMQGIFGESVSVTYTYNNKGQLCNMEALIYQDEELSSTYTYAFDEYMLFYSENPSSADEISKIYFTDIDTVLNEVW